MRHHEYKQHGTLTLMAVGSAALTAGLNALQAIIEGLDKQSSQLAKR